MKLYKTLKGNILQTDEKFYQIDRAWDELINREGLYNYLRTAVTPGNELPTPQAATWCEKEILAPIGSQEVWAAGVTYLRSRDARMEESKDSGGADFYDKVYAAERPELFFKSLAHRVSAHGEPVYIRKDSAWNVPEPELTLFSNSKGNIQAYTIGIDMTSPHIHSTNPLSLPHPHFHEPTP